ncbi:helix-turn-helix transcriptional regulator [Rubrivivax rivuli]|uniref:HTH luxR-type domain-containing protein n=1 Tax=Rubrivivax rivuli TaxID=1862385 RepID=A0A437RR16_9BURK|nr:LuxR C-terminal-related transcriptional regulator [Rubrivivax rivuli]RVU49236.1 hypothetical protein EOE66_01260 [Rubrivivax rivuli]
MTTLPASSAAAPAPRPALAPDAARLAEAADALAAALLVLQADGTLLHANAAARVLLQDGRDWQLDAEQRVRPVGGAADEAFDTALSAVRAAPAALRVPLAHPAGARLCRLPGPEDGACTLLLSLPPAPGHANDLPSYASAHALSPTETRVLQRLALGEGSAQAAAALGLRATTVRTHVLALRRKTRHASLAALVQTLGRLPPVAPPMGPSHRAAAPAWPR